MAQSQFALLRQRRFLPYFLVQALGAFNDNVFRQAIIGLLGYMAIAQADRGIYTQLAPAVFILPYFRTCGCCWWRSSRPACSPRCSGR